MAVSLCRLEETVNRLHEVQKVDNSPMTVGHQQSPDLTPSIYLLWVSIYVPLVPTSKLYDLESCSAQAGI